MTRRTRPLTLADLIAAVLDVAKDEHQATEVVLRMLRSGAVRLTRPVDWRC
jgi:ribosome-interacting GTPase 1